MAWQILYRRNGHWLPGKTHQQKKDATEQAPAQDEREAFESWYLGDTGFGPESLTRDAHGDYVDPDAVSCWEGWQARAKRPAQTEQQPAYVECRECTECGHVGINDAHQTDATCAMCDWSGPSPVEDQCPDCGKENVMGAACPKCSGRYRILAETHVAAPIAQTGQQPVLSNCLDLVEKMTVSVDVSTCDDDAFNRLFCKVAGVQEESDGSWTILAVDPEPNFAAPIAQIAPQPVAINPDPPELMIRWHESPESVHRAMWESVAIREGMTYDELLAEGVTCGFDESGNEVEMEAGADIEGMRMQGCWAFVDTLNSCIHAWAAPDTDRGLVLHMLAHEISHATGTPHPDGFQEEMRAEQFGRVAAAAYRMLLDKDRPQCTAPACGCADAYCMAWPDEAAPIAQTAPQQSGWISVEDRLPEARDGTRYLVARDCGNGTRKSISSGFLLGGEWHISDGVRTFRDMGYRVTHWQPLPAAPQGGE